MAQKYLEIIEKLGPDRVLRDESLAKHTTFGIGGRADLFYVAKTTEELVKAVKLCRRLGVPYFLLASGSKLLVADTGFRGLVIKIHNSKFKMPAKRDSFGIQNTKIVAESGVLLNVLVEAAAKTGLSGFEFTAGIPGTIGGAVVGNAGAWQQTIGEKVLRVKILDEAGQVKWLDQKECQFDYRQSRFKKSDEVVLEVELQVVKGDPQVIKKKVASYLAQRQSQPKEPSVGSIFINPKPEQARFGASPKPDSAGRMIEKCGLKGKRIGDAQISPKHANFIVNLGRARASEVIGLIKLIEKRVRRKFGVKLEREICLLGFGKIDKYG